MDRQTVGQMTKPIFTIRDYANSPKHGWMWTRSYLIRNYHEVLRKVWLCSFVCDILCALIHKKIILKRRKNALAYMNVILSHIYHRYVSVSHVGILMSVSTRYSYRCNVSYTVYLQFYFVLTT